MERKLATIARINDINPIEGADAIEVATVRGWKVVVKKGEYNVGDLCIYCEIDSILPEKEEFEFLRNSKFRIRTVRLRGQVSQGICFPVSILETTNLNEGDDVTELIGVTKYEPPIPANLAGKMKGYFPSHSVKTDEERIQNLTVELPELSKYVYFATEKLDGSSVTYYLKDNVFGVCSRNLDLIETDDNTFWKVARQEKIEEKMREFAKANSITNFNLQGEVIGEGIQKNKYKLKGQTVRFFRSFNIDNFEFFAYEDFISMIKEMGLITVPIVEIDVVIPDTVDDLLAFAEGKSALNKNTEREGIVFVSSGGTNGRISFKVISNKFLLKNKE